MMVANPVVGYVEAHLALRGGENYGKSGAISLIVEAHLVLRGGENI